LQLDFTQHTLSGSALPSTSALSAAPQYDA
jgi:hypothetical protein